MVSAFFLVFCCVLLAKTAALHFPHASEYTGQSVLSPDEYELYWELKPNSDTPKTISLVIHAKTAGWVGFGLGEPGSGSMPGSDFVVGWVDDQGSVHAEDRYAAPTLGPAPILDDCQSWTVDGGDYQDGWTTVRVHRALTANGDTQDRDFGSGLLKMLWAHGKSDTFMYHGSTRGTGGIAFHGKVNNNFNGPDIEPPFLFPNTYTITADETVYHDAIYTVPANLGCISVVGFDHHLNPATSKYVHHFVVYATRTGADGKEVTEIVWAWAPGVAPLVIPSEAALLFGTCGYTKARMNVHYNNPSGTGVGQVDTSGVKVYWTKKTRPHTAGIITLGDVIVTQKVPIPQGSGRSTYHYDCPADCTKHLTEPLHVYGIMQHMHSTGKQTITTHWRGENRLPDIGRTDFFNFNFQTTMLKDATILPGDSLRTSCTFQQRSNRETKFNDASSDEMCVQFVYVWPRPPISNCGFAKGKTTCGSLLSNPTVVDDDSVRVTLFGQKPSVLVCDAGDSKSIFGQLGGGDTVVVHGRNLRH